VFDQTIPQGGSSCQGYQALQFPKVTSQRMPERTQLEVPSTESKDDDQPVDDILSTVAPSSGVCHSCGQDPSLDESGP